MNDFEKRMKNKVAAVENQARCFKERLDAFRNAPLWKRLIMALKGEV